MVEEKKAKKIYTLEEIKFIEANKTMAMVACVPIIGLILLFVEKNDLFVRYMGAQFTIVGLLFFVDLIPVIGWILAPILSLLVFALVVISMLKVSKGERFDVPVASGFALKLMSLI